MCVRICLQGDLSTLQIMWYVLVLSSCTGLFVGILVLPPMNLPTNGGSIGVMIGGFDPAALRALTDVGDRIMATPPGILPLDPMAVSSH